jgi:hypothetical protein
MQNDDASITSAKLCDISELRAIAEELRNRYLIEGRLKERLSSLPGDLKEHSARLRNMQANTFDLAACLELHFTASCGELDPNTKCNSCWERGTIIHGTIDYGGYTPADYNDNYMVWCTNCFWSWYWFSIDYLGTGPLKFNYENNMYE